MLPNTEVSWLQWLIQTYELGQLWVDQPTYIISQAVYLLAGAITLIHAFGKGGRWPYLWFSTILHGVFTDNFWHFVVPAYDNFWHSRSPIMLLGGRLPLHILFLYPAFIYQAVYAVSKLNLPRYAEPFAVGLITVLIDLPYDIVAVKFVHWSWHDTDPNIFDRHYWVPWNSYYFHASFAASFFFFFNTSKQMFAPTVEQWTSVSTAIELKSLVISSLLGMFGGVLMFIPIYHPLHDVLKIHSEVTFFLLFTIFGIFIINGLLRRRKTSNTTLTTLDYMLLAQLALHYIIYWIFVVFFDPENERSVGLHEPVGPCNEVSSLVSPLGQTLNKRKYFCPNDYDEAYFDFHCVKGQKPAIGDTWYTICGTPFQNRSEYIVVLTMILFAATGVFYAIYFQSSHRRKKEKYN